MDKENSPYLSGITGKLFQFVCFQKVDLLSESGVLLRWVKFVHTECGIPLVQDTGFKRFILLY